MVAQLHHMSGEMLLLRRVFGTTEDMKQIEQELLYRARFGPPEIRLRHCMVPAVRKAYWR